MKAEDERCSKCGGLLVPIVYGFPGPEMMEAEERGEIILGGCEVYDGQPAIDCPRCHRERAWGVL